MCQAERAIWAKGRDRKEWCVCETVRRQDRWAGEGIVEIKIEDIDDIMKVDFIEMTGSHRRFFEQNNFMIDFRQMILAAFCSIRCFENNWEEETWAS